MLHYTRELNHSLCRGSHHGIYIHAHERRSLLLRLHFLSPSRCFTRVKVLRLVEVCVHESELEKSRGAGSMAGLRRLTPIEEKDASEHRNVLTFSTPPANKTRSHKITAGAYVTCTNGVGGLVCFLGEVEVNVRAKGCTRERRTPARKPNPRPFFFSFRFYFPICNFLPPAERILIIVSD